MLSAASQPSVSPTGRNDLTTPLLFLACALFLLLPCPWARAESPAKTPSDRFLHPPAEARILKIIHSWPDAPAAQDALIQRLAGQGFGGVVCNVSFAEYLESEAKWQGFARAIGEARKAGFSLWLYDEKGYPSGAAGGLVLRDHPEWEAEGLLIADTETDGGTVTLDLPPGKPFLMAAFPVRNGTIDPARRSDLSAQVKDGKLAWTAPAGRWRVMAITQSRLFEGTHVSVSLSDHIPYPNLLSPEPTHRFLELTHDRYAAHLGADLGKHFVSTFTDEPSLMSLFLRPMPYRVLPWSPGLPAAFKKRHGAELAPLVPALVADAGPAGARVRYDFWDTVGELVSQNYFGQIQEWCSRHNVRSGGHLLMEESLVNQVALYGDFLRCLRRLDAPSIDCLTSIPEQVPWSIARLAASAADLEGRAVTMCETSDHSQHYRPPGDKRPVRVVTPAEIRGTCNRLMVEGIDTITSYYSFQDVADEQLRELNDYVGRCCSSLKGGFQAADVAVLYPMQSAWPRFVPSRHLANDSPAAARIETIFHDVSDSLFAAGRDFTYVDERALAEAKPGKGVLTHGNLRWRVIVLPGADTLPIAAWKNLERFVESGGVLLAVGALPQNSETEFPSSLVQKLATQLFGDLHRQPGMAANRANGAAVFLPASSTSLLPAVLNGLLEPDVAAGGDRAPIRYTHRRIDGREIFFVINDSAQPWTNRLSLAVSGSGEQCDPATGQILPLAQGTNLVLGLPAYGGMIFRFATGQTPRRLEARSGSLPGMVTRALPAATPVIARGEFVREELSPATIEPPGQDGWRITGALTKSGVDTYLFVRFPYTAAVDLRDSDYLVLDTTVPEGQRTSTQLLVILHEKSGADYLASSGRFLNSAGRDQSFIALNRFHLAGWSKDDNNRLDLDDISEVRVGWGGYFGTEGEQVRFTLDSPRTASVSSPKITREPYGQTQDGQTVDRYTLRNSNGLTAKVITYGAIIESLEVPDRSGRLANVTANCASLADYERRSPCFGAVLGRYANRIAGAKFTLDGREFLLPKNAGPNHIHGGNGFHKRVWQAEPLPRQDAVALKLTYTSRDGEEGYPGTLVCTIIYELNNRNEWKMDYTATTDKPTVLNLANHAYWNLAGAQSGTVLNEVLTVNADRYLLAGDALIPTGKLAPVTGTPVDFRLPHPIGERIGQITEKQFNGGYDHCLVVNHKTPGDLAFCARVKDPVSGRTMEVFTTQPGVQIFSANFAGGAFQGPGGYAYPRNLGLCLETQHFPDSPNQPGFPSTVLRPGEVFRATTIHKFGIQTNE